MFNSILQNSYHKLVNKINNISLQKNNYNINNIKSDILYKSILSISQKLLIFIIYYNYITNNNITKMSLLFLPLYTLTNNLIYQYEYILHNYYSYKINDHHLIIYYDFCKLYKKYINYNSFKILGKNFVYLTRKNF